MGGVVAVTMSLVTFGTSCPFHLTVSQVVIVSACKLFISGVSLVGETAFLLQISDSVIKHIMVFSVTLLT